MHTSRLFRALALVGVLLSTNAHAQLAKVSTILTTIQSTLQGVGVTVFTMALIWAGYKMAFQHAKWAEISNVVIGGILVGGAAGIASFLVS